MTRLEAWTQLYAAALSGFLATGGYPGDSKRAGPEELQQEESHCQRFADALAARAKIYADRAILVWDEARSREAVGER